MGRQSFEKDTMALVLASNQRSFLGIRLGALHLRVGKDEVLEAAVPDQVCVAIGSAPIWLYDYMGTESEYFLADFLLEADQYADGDHHDGDAQAHAPDAHAENPPGMLHRS